MLQLKQGFHVLLKHVVLLNYKTLGCQPRSDQFIEPSQSEVV